MSTLIVPVPVGGISLLSASTGPWMASVPGSLVRFAIVKLTIPAPNSLGETATPSLAIFTETSAGMGGLGSFLKSSRPQPAITSAVTRAAANISTLPLSRSMRGGI